MTGPLHIHLDAVGGLAGDMFVAAMLDALPDLRPRVLRDVGGVLPRNWGAARLSERSSGGIAAKGFSLPEEATAASGDHHGHALRTLAGLRETVLAADLADGTAAAAVGILEILAEAEAGVHGVAVDEVHFHEIGNWDTLMDTVAAGSIFAALPGAGWSLSPLPLGGGTVVTAHGRLPVPAPATAAILAGYDWHDDGVPGERVTPTGAAIARFVTGGAPTPRRGGGRLRAVGYGAGTRKLDGLPNVLRSLVFETASTSAGPQREEAVVIEFDVDDMTGEEIAQAADRLRAEPAVIDATLTAGIGKKGRPSTMFRLLAREEALDAVAEAVFLQTSTLGLRWYPVHRLTLPREQEADAAAGVRIKRARRPDGAETVKVESDDLADGRTLAERRRIKAERER